MIRAISSRFTQTISSRKGGFNLGNIQFVRQLSSEFDNDVPENTNNLQNIDNFKCINRVTLLGRATGPAYYHSSPTVEMASFTLATNEIRRNRSNELIKRSEFHKIQVFIPRLVQKTKQVVDKGSRILVEGKITYNVRKNESGNSHFTNIVADNILFITGNREASIEQEDENVPEIESMQ